MASFLNPASHPSLFLIRLPYLSAISGLVAVSKLPACSQCMLAGPSRCERTCRNLIPAFFNSYGTQSTTIVAQSFLPSI